MSWHRPKPRKSVTLVEAGLPVPDRKTVPDVPVDLIESYDDDLAPILPVIRVLAKAHKTGRKDWYAPGSNAHPQKMYVEVVQSLLERYAPVEPGRPPLVIVDPFCGIGTTLVEAMRKGHEAIGIELEPSWVAYARENTELSARRLGVQPAKVVYGDSTKIGKGLDFPYVFDLILTSPPFGPTAHSAGDSDLQRHLFKTKSLTQGQSLGSSPGQLGDCKQFTYPVFIQKVSDTFEALKGSLGHEGYTLVHCRRYIRKKAVVEIDKDIRTVLVALGFGYLGCHPIPVRPTFFREMYYKKTPEAPRIKWEYVLVFQNP